MKQHFILIVFSALIVTPILCLTVKHTHMLDGFSKMSCDLSSQTTNPSCSINTAP